jgi:P27 family predicted phage terminase small subunit
MGSRGPKSAPTAIKLAKGERRPSRVNHSEPDLPAVSSLPTPRGLTGAGKREWKRIAAILRDAGILRETDTVVLENYCRSLTNLRDFETKAVEFGPEKAIATGIQGVVIKLRAQVNALGRELGLTPSSRSSIHVPKAAAPTGGDPKLKRYLQALPGGKHRA